MWAQVNKVQRKELTKISNTIWKLMKYFKVFP